MDTRESLSTETEFDSFESVDSTLFNAAVVELTELAKQLAPNSTLTCDFFDRDAYDWASNVRALGLLTTHAELVGNQFVPSEEMSALLRHGRAIVKRIYPFE